MALRKFTQEALETTVTNMAKTIATAKVEVTKNVISRLRIGRKFPQDNRYYAYIGKNVAANTRDATGALVAKTPEVVRFERLVSPQLYKDPEAFFRIMVAKPLNYVRPWVFRPLHVSSPEELIEAVVYAYRLATRLYQMQAARFPVYKVNPILLLIRHTDNTVQTVVSGVPDASQLRKGSELLLVNTSQWAAYAEALSVERWKTNGMMYQAAQMAAKKYPNINVNYTYTNTIDNKNFNLGIPIVHRPKPMMIPVIRFGLRWGDNRTRRLKFSKPGRNIRRNRRKSRSRG